MKGYVEMVEKSKSGKAWRVKVGGGWINAQFDSKIEEAQGKNIDFLTKDDPKYGIWLQSWVFDQPAAAPQKTPSESVARSQAGEKNGDRWWLPFCSNQCAHAIAAGKILGVSDLKSWAIAAKRAIEAADNDQNIPF